MPLPIPTTNDQGGKLILGCAAAFIGVVALALLSLIVVMGTIGLRAMNHQARLMEDSIETPATIVSSKVQDITTSGASRTSARSVRFVPEVRFRFELDGRTGTGQNVFPMPRNGDQVWASRLVSRYPTGRSVTAWVDPNHPDDAFLEKEWVRGPYGLVLAISASLGILMAMISVVTFFLPRVSSAAAIIGVAAWLLGSLHAGLHYWNHARPDGAGLGWLEIIWLLIVVGAVLPALAWIQGRRWSKKGSGVFSPPQ
jgi:hypothetical protein